MRLLRYVGYVTTSQTGRTLDFSSRALLKPKGQRRGAPGAARFDRVANASLPEGAVTARP